MQHPRVLNTFFCNKYPLHAISRCCVQLRVVFSRPAHRQQHCPHKHFSILPLDKTLPAHSQRQQQQTSEHVTDMPIPQVMWHLSRPPKLSLKERTSERICEHVVDVSVPQVVEQLFVVPKISDRILQRTVEQVSRCSGDACRRTKGRGAEVRVTSQNPPADSNRSLTPQFRR